MQLRCKDEANGKQRILVVTGVYPVKAVGFTIAEAFSKACLLAKARKQIPSNLLIVSIERACASLTENAGTLSRKRPARTPSVTSEADNCDTFDPHPNKGKNPPGMAFALMRDGQLQSLKATVKIVQAVQDPGDTMNVRMDGLDVLVTLDAIKCKSDEGYECIKNRPMPRCWRRWEPDSSAYQALEPHLPARS